MKKYFPFALLVLNVLVIYFVMRIFNVGYNSTSLFIAAIINTVMYIAEIYYISKIIKRNAYDKNN